MKIFSFLFLALFVSPNCLADRTLKMPAFDTNVYTWDPGDYGKAKTFEAKIRVRLKNISAIAQKVSVKLNNEVVDLTTTFGTAFYFSSPWVTSSDGLPWGQQTLSITRSPDTKTLTLAANASEIIEFELVCGNLKPNAAVVCGFAFPGNRCLSSDTNAGFRTRYKGDIELTVSPDKGAVLGTLFVEPMICNGNFQTQIPYIKELNGGRAF